MAALTPSCDPIHEKYQSVSGSVDGVPTFPCTSVPIMPPDLYWKGLSSKEGLHEHEGHDPVVVAKGPRLMRARPPGAGYSDINRRWLRSTWFLKHGVWRKVEDHVAPELGMARIGEWIQRAVWQFHPVPQETPKPIAASARGSKPHYMDGVQENYPYDKQLLEFVESLSKWKMTKARVDSLGDKSVSLLKKFLRSVHESTERTPHGFHMVAAFHKHMDFINSGREGPFVPMYVDVDICPAWDGLMSVLFDHKGKALGKKLTTATPN